MIRRAFASGLRELDVHCEVLRTLTEETLMRVRIDIAFFKGTFEREFGGLFPTESVCRQHARRVVATHRAR
jgi:hypothetical protein